MIEVEEFFTPMGLRTLIMGSVGNQLGTYVLPNASTFVPAIAVLPDKKYGNNYPPPETKISGIEIIIHKPRPNSISRLGNDSLRTYKWEIYLNQWDGHGDLNVIVENLINAFQDNGITFINPVFPAYNLDMGILPFCRIALIQKSLRVVDQD